MHCVNTVRVGTRVGGSTGANVNTGAALNSGAASRNISSSPGTTGTGTQTANRGSGTLTLNLPLIPAVQVGLTPCGLFEIWYRMPGTSRLIGTVVGTVYRYAMLHSAHTVKIPSKKRV